MPTTLRPPTCTSPGPRPAKQTRRDHGVRTMRAPVDLGAGHAAARRAPPPTTRPASARPGRRRRPTAGRRRGRSRRPRAPRPGTSSTAPPPLRRRTSSTPAAADAPSSTTRRGLRRAEHQSRSVDLQPPHRPARRRHDVTGVELGRRAPVRLDAPGPAAVIATTRRVDTVQWARYGFQDVGHAADGHDHPRQLARRGRVAGQAHAGLVGRAVPLAQVARPAGGGDVLPDVLAAAAAGQHVVDRVGVARRSTGSGGCPGRTRPGATARCAGGTAPSRRSAAGSRAARATQRRAERNSVPSSWRMSAFSDSTRQTARRTGHDAERLVGRIEDERAPHRREPRPRTCAEWGFGAAGAARPRSSGGRPLIDRPPTGGTSGGSARRRPASAGCCGSPYCVSIRNRR